MNNTKENPKGIDYEIQRIQNYLYDNLGFDSMEAFGRCYKVLDNDQRVIPAHFKQGKDYKGLLTDLKSNLKFFFMENPKTETSGYSFTDVDLIFLVNLKKVYPESDYRNDEEFRITVYEKLRRKLGFGDIDTIKGIDALSGFDHNLIDMQPYHFIKFQFELKYILNN
jgi:hypothetical protein